jgi:hypothetical protein
LEQLLWTITNVPGITPDDTAKLDLKNWQIWNDNVNKYSPNAANFCMLHFGDFTKLPYFSRIWVVQEVAYASMAYVVYGGQITPYQQFYEFIQQMLKRTTSTVSFFSGTDAYSIAAEQHGRIFLGPEPGLALTGNFFSAGEWLTDCGRRSFRDPRDKVYDF